jgi:hypothetical protein
MKQIPFPILALALAIGGCSSIPEGYPPLAEAETTYHAAADDPKVVQYAPLELEKAKRSLERAEAIQKEGDDDLARLDHQAYLARQQARLGKVCETG